MEKTGSVAMEERLAELERQLAEQKAQEQAKLVTRLRHRYLQRKERRTGAVGTGRTATTSFRIRMKKGISFSGLMNRTETRATVRNPISVIRFKWIRIIFS